MTARFALLATLLLSLLAASVPALRAEDPADPYQEVLQYRFNGPRTAAAAIEAEVCAAKPEQIAAIEARLLAVLQSPQATLDARDWVCRQLRQVGSERSVPALAPLLADKDLSVVARMALQSIPGAKVDEALREAVAKTRGDLKAGVIQTLGVRGDRQAVPLAASLIADPNAAVADAAIYTLGHVGGPDALKALQAARVPESLQRARFHALLLCAEQMAAAGDAAGAAGVYQSAFKESADAVIQTAALRGILLCDKANAAASAIAALRSENRRLRMAAAKFVGELAGGDLLGRVLADMASLPADAQATLLATVRDPAAVPAALAAAKGSDEGIRVAALRALGRVGDAACVPVLLQTAAAGAGDTQAAARKSLQDLRGQPVEAALIAALSPGEQALRIEALRALAARGASSAVPAVLQAVDDPEPGVENEAFAALGELATAPSLPALVKLLSEAKAEARRAAAEKALVAAGRRMADKEAAAVCVAACLSGAEPEVRSSLLRVLARMPSAKSLSALRAAAGDADAAVKDTAIRALAEWPDAAALADVLAVARSEPSPVHKVLAIRGAARMAMLPGAPPAAQTAKLLAEALALADRPEEKKQVLAALGATVAPASLEAASACLSDPKLEVEAATAVVTVARKLARTDAEAAAAAMRKVLDVCKNPAARQVAESAMMIVEGMVDIAPQGTASSPDGLDADGASGGDQAAIDGDQNTYWDEADGRPLYRLVVTFKQPERIAAVSILGYAHHNYAPKDFEVLCDGKPVKKVVDAQYSDNFLVLRLDETTCTTVELKITGYYGRSPGIRELGVYRPAKR